MKRIISFLLCFILLLSVFTSAEAETKKRDAVEFIQTFIRRVDEMKYEHNKDLDVDLLFSLFSWYQLSDDDLLIGSEGGLLTVSITTGEIESLTTTLYDNLKDSDNQLRSIMLAIISFSALEFTPSDDDSLKFSYRYGFGEYANAIDKAMDIWYDTIMPKLPEYAVKDAMLGNKVLIYEGNYNYYLSFRDTEGDGKKTESFYLIAESK